MIVILAELSLHPDSVATFIQAAEDATQARTQPGCQYYAFSRHLTDTTTFHISEVWETEETFAAHVASPGHQRFRDALATCTVLSRSIDRYDAPTKITLA
jgi:quinol monooxygenase YgiN